MCHCTSPSPAAALQSWLHLGPRQDLLMGCYTQLFCPHYMEARRAFTMWSYVQPFPSGPPLRWLHLPFPWANYTQLFPSCLVLELAASWPSLDGVKLGGFPVVPCQSWAHLGLPSVAVYTAIPSPFTPDLAASWPPHLPLYLAISQVARAQSWPHVCPGQDLLMGYYIQLFFFLPTRTGCIFAVLPQC